MTDHYSTLGVPRSADGAAIKRAYRRRSKEAHPDRPGGNTQAMVAINLAYETLSDPARRAHYDQHGEDCPPPPPLDVLARAMVMQLFLQALGQASDQEDLVRVTRGGVKAAQSQARSAIHGREAKLAKLEKSRGRLKYRGAEGNFLDDLFVQQISALREQIEKARAHVKVCERALEVLQEFEYHPDPSGLRGVGNGV